MSRNRMPNIESTFVRIIQKSKLGNSYPMAW